MFFTGFICLCYLCAEILFYLAFVFYIQKHANDQSVRVSQPYHDYGTERAKLVKRILDRMEETCIMTKQDFPSCMHTYFSRWFYEHPKEAGIPLIASCDSSNSKKDDLYIPDEETNSEAELFRDCVTSFLAWFFFDRKVEDLDEPWQIEQLEKMNQLISSTGIDFSKKLPRDPQTGESLALRSRRVSLENVNPIHKPLFVYLSIWVVRQVGHFILFYIGFQRYQIKMKRIGSKKNLAMTYWYRDAQHNSTGSKNQSYSFMGSPPVDWQFIYLCFKTLSLEVHFSGDTKRSIKIQFFCLKMKVLHVNGLWML